jgi:hypothetical protein
MKDLIPYLYFVSTPCKLGGNVGQHIHVHDDRVHIRHVQGPSGGTTLRCTTMATYTHTVLQEY